MTPDAEQGQNDTPTPAYTRTCLVHFCPSCHPELLFQSGKVLMVLTQAEGTLVVSSETENYCYSMTGHLLVWVGASDTEKLWRIYFRLGIPYFKTYLVQRFLFSLICRAKFVWRKCETFDTYQNQF